MLPVERYNFSRAAGPHNDLSGAGTRARAQPDKAVVTSTAKNTGRAESGGIVEAPAKQTASSYPKIRDLLQS